MVPDPSRWGTFNEDGTIKYNFDGIKAIYIPNKSDRPTLRDLGLTIVNPFYNEKERFLHQFSIWQSYDEIVKRAVNINVVDDCSSSGVDSLVPRSVLKRMDFNLRVHRVMKDLKWNTPGALNLGVHTAPTDWVLFMDSDCYMENDSLSKLLTDLHPDPDISYYFMRKRITNDPEKAKVIKPLSCSVLIHKSLFNSIGGFDEDFTGERSGGYGFFDNDFVDRLDSNRRRAIADVIITENLELDKSIQERTNVSKDHLDINRRLWRSKQRGITPRNLNRLQFEWQKVLEVERW